MTRIVRKFQLLRLLERYFINIIQILFQDEWYHLEKTNH